MKLMMLLSIFLCTLGSFIGGETVFPDQHMEQSKIVDLYPSEHYRYTDFVVKDRAEQKKYHGLWSTVNQVNLENLKVSVTASSCLSNRYSPQYALDGKPETAWVEGSKGNGEGEWLQILLQAEKFSPSSTPFTVFEIGIIPGYAKSPATWTENNRVKTALLVIHSQQPVPEELEWVTYRLHLNDSNELQYFWLDYLKAVGNQDPMEKTVWLRIEDVYPGTKFHDTCISEVVLVGGCLP